MASKRAKAVPKYIQKMFAKPQYKIGDPVCFIWLNQKRYGIVVNIKQVRNEEIGYTVSSFGTKYPCGIEAKGHRNKYHTVGWICVDHGEDAEQLQRRAKHAHETGRVSKNSGGTGICSTTSGSVGNSTSKPVPTNRNRTRTNRKPVGDKSSSKSVSTKRGNKKLDVAIKKQRDFLNGFVKKD